jgi:hypothetical protein
VTTIVQKFSKESLSAAHSARKKHLKRGPDANPADEEEAEAQDEESDLKPHHYYVYAKCNKLDRDAQDQAKRSPEQRRQEEARLADEALDLCVCLPLVARGPDSDADLLLTPFHTQRLSTRVAQSVLADLSPGLCQSTQPPARGSQHPEEVGRAFVVTQGPSV